MKNKKIYENIENHGKKEKNNVNIMKNNEKDKKRKKT